jgi:hypothetical protein
MEEKKTPLSFHVIYWIMNIITALFAIVSIGVIVFYVMLWTDFFGNDLQLHVNLPGQVNIVSPGTMDYGGSTVNIELVEAVTRIHFINTPPSLARKFILILIGVCAFGLFLLWTFRQFIVNVRKGLIFTISNIILLQRISYTLVGFWVFMIVYMRTTYYLISARVEVENTEIVSEFDNYPWILLMALFLWVLSHIFIRGLKLKEEQDLTV